MDYILTAENLGKQYKHFKALITLHDSGEIVFSNTALGLNEVQVGKLFDRFFTVEAARNSNGLGLAISKTLVEQMSGTISAELKQRRLYIIICFN